MRAFFSNKIWIVVFSVIALGALIALATGIENVSFREGQPFGRQESHTVRSVTLEAVHSIISIPLRTQLTFWILILLMFVMIGLLLSPEMRKRLIRMLFRAALTYWALYILFTRYPAVLDQLRLEMPAENGGLGEASNAAAAPVFTPPEASSWISYVLSVVIIAVILVLAWRAYAVWKELNASAPAISKERIAKIARSSLKDLYSGRESTDVILNCYYWMSDVVSNRRNLDRSASMTPSEFASRLESAGLPFDAVRALTGLFETVRYGGRKSDPKMVHEAVTCLTSILNYCGEPV